MSLNSPARPPTWNMHIMGLVSLLRIKNRPQFFSGSGRRFFWMIMGLIEAQSLATNVDCPKEIIDWLEANIADFVPEELDMHHALVHGYHASVLCAKIRKVINTGTVEHQESQSIYTIMEAARKIGREDESSLAQDPLIKPLRLRQAHIHNFHRTVRVHVQYSILELLRSKFATSDPTVTTGFLEKEQKLAVGIVRTLADSTLATVPYILGSKGPSYSPTSEGEEKPKAERPRCWVDGMRLLWPLRVIGSRKVITMEQRKAVEDVLERLNSELYIRSAIVPYAIPKRMQLESFPQLKEPKTRKACKTCRRRKVKCDEERPLCRRCHVSQLDCEGYDNPSVDQSEPSDLDQQSLGSIGRLDELTLLQETS